MLDAIRLENISKAYKDTKAVKDLEMMVPQGVVYGMLGRNGAGKNNNHKNYHGTGSDRIPAGYMYWERMRPGKENLP